MNILWILPFVPEKVCLYRFAVIKESARQHAIQNQQCSSCVLWDLKTQVPCYYCWAPVSFISNISKTYSINYHQTMLLRDKTGIAGKRLWVALNFNHPACILAMWCAKLRSTCKHVLSSMLTCKERHIGVLGVTTTLLSCCMWCWDASRARQVCAVKMSTCTA